MKQKIIFICLLLIIGHSLCESYGLLNVWMTNLKTINFDLFISPSYKKQMSLYYYIKMPCDDMLFMLLCFIIAYIGKQFSIKIYYLGLLYFFYHFIDMIFFWWDFKTNHLLYYIMLGVLVATTGILMYPFKEAKGMYRSLV
jgi:hypothetical protein